MIVKLELRITRIGQLAQESACQLRKLRPQLEVQIRAQIGKRAVQLIVDAPVVLEQVQLGDFSLQILCRGLRGGQGKGRARDLLLRARCRDF